MKKYSISSKNMFSGELAFLSNMYPCVVTVNIYGQFYTFKSSEAAFQAGKCTNEKDIECLTQFTNGHDARRYGQNMTIDPNWEDHKMDWMRYVCKCKFKQNQDLCKELLETYPLALVETNTQKDTFWGVYQGNGENHLGKILMEIREQQLQAAIDEHFKTKPSIPDTTYGMPTDVFLSVLKGKTSIWTCSHTTGNVYEYTVDGFDGTVFYEKDYCKGCQMDNIEFHPEDYNKRWFTSKEKARDYANKKG